MKADKALTNAFNTMHQALTPQQLGAVNALRHELYVEVDRLRDKYRITLGVHPADANRLMELVCSIPVFGKGDR